MGVKKLAATFAGIILSTNASAATVPAQDIEIDSSYTPPSLVQNTQTITQKETIEKNLTFLASIFSAMAIIGRDRGQKRQKKEQKTPKLTLVSSNDRAKNSGQDTNSAPAPLTKTG